QVVLDLAGRFGVAGAVHRCPCVLRSQRGGRAGTVPSSDTAPASAHQAILNRATDCFSSSAVFDSSRTICAVERVPSPVCSVTPKMCWMFAATTFADCASDSAWLEI